MKQKIKTKRIYVKVDNMIFKNHCLDYINALLNEAVEELKNGETILFKINKKDMEASKKKIFLELKNDNYTFVKDISKQTGISINYLINNLLKNKLSI